jgi:UDP-N-acetylenolpyruvoylglucosamine reductase
VLVNTGEARGEDILLLAQEMSSSILSQFGIGLVPEVQII